MPPLQFDIDTKARQSFDTTTQKTIEEKGGGQQQLLENKQHTYIWVVWVRSDCELDTTILSW